MDRRTCFLVGAILMADAAAAQNSSGASGQKRSVHILKPGDAGSAASPTVAEVATPVAPVASVGSVTPAPPPRPAPACPRPVAATDFRFDDSAASSARLAGQLRKGGRVAVDLATPYPVRAPAPAPLGPWLAAVRSSGGSVDVVSYCRPEGARGFFRALAALFGGGDPGKTYRSAKNYNAVLHSDLRTQTVTQVEFVPRPAGMKKDY